MIEDHGEQQTSLLNRTQQQQPPHNGPDQSLPAQMTTMTTTTMTTAHHPGAGGGQPPQPLQIPRNRSMGSLRSSEPADPRVRFSLDAATAAEFDSLTRSPLRTEHEHGLGISGLRRIRQQHPLSRTPSFVAHSRTPTGAGPAPGLSRSASMNVIMHAGRDPSSAPFPASQSSLSFSEDLIRFPSESLHSFSFAHQSEEFLHTRQNVLRRSLEFMRDHMGWSVPSSASAAALASAQARVTGDVEAQSALDLLARAQLIGAGNLPNPSAAAVGPLTGPAFASSENPFDKHFAQSPGSDPNAALPLSPMTSSRPTGKLPAAHRPPHPSLSLPMTEEPCEMSLSPSSSSSSSSSVDGDDGAGNDIDHGSPRRVSTDESRTTVQPSPPLSRPMSLKRTMTDTLTISVQERLMDALAQPFLAGVTGQPPPPPPPPLHLHLGPGSAMSEPVMSLSPTVSHCGSAAGGAFPSALGPAVHGHTNRWVPAAQAIFTTQARPPWTILAANDLACLVFGVTRAEIRKMAILEVVQEERREWLERRLLRNDDHEEDYSDCDGGGGGSSKKSAPTPRAPIPQRPIPAVGSTLLGGRSGITAQLLSKPNSRSQTPKQQQQQPPPNQPPRRAQTVHSGDSSQAAPGSRRSRSNSVILCGDVVPIQKRNGATGSASLWVKEKRVGLIWVLEEIHEDVAVVALEDEEGVVRSVSGSWAAIWGGGDGLADDTAIRPGIDIGRLIPRIPRQGIDPRTGDVDFAQLARRRFFTCPNGHGVNIPCTVGQVRGRPELRVSSLPHMAGIVVVCPVDLKIKSSNSAFCGALFGYERPDGMPIGGLVPAFDRILDILTEDDEVELVDGMVVPEHSFRRASATLGLREGRADAAACFLRPEGLPALHRDGSELRIDVQMRVVKSEKKRADQRPRRSKEDEDEDEGEGEDKDEDMHDDADSGHVHEEIYAGPEAEMVYALWITYSRHLHAKRPLTLAAVAAAAVADELRPSRSQAPSPLHQPSPGQTLALHPREMTPDPDRAAGGAASPPHLPHLPHFPPLSSSSSSSLTKQIKHAVLSAGARLAGAASPTRSDQRTQQLQPPPQSPPAPPSPARVAEPAPKKTIDDFVILEDMGQGAYGQVKLARYKKTGQKMVLKYVTKRRILVDTWTRDRKLGTVPLEIHVLSFLRRPELRHPNIVEMESFFEDDVNYYIEMVPHGLPGMDLFDYIELRSSMSEDECQGIFAQVARAIHHLHTRALVVHRDIKDENVILDGEGNIKLIDFGSAAYIRSGPFDVFVGTIDYAAPEVLAGKPYRGKEQDVWALGILLYTIIYKENPFYSIDEIMDRDLRVPFTISDESIDLVRRMLERDVAKRYTIEQVLEHPWCRAAGG